MAGWLLIAATAGFVLVVLFLGRKRRAMILYSSSWLMTLQCRSSGKNIQAHCKSALQLRPAPFSTKFWYRCISVSFSRWTSFLTPFFLPPALNMNVKQYISSAKIHTNTVFPRRCWGLPDLIRDALHASCPLTLFLAPVLSVGYMRNGPRFALHCNPVLRVMVSGLKPVKIWTGVLEWQVSMRTLIKRQ